MRHAACYPKQNGLQDAAWNEFLREVFMRSLKGFQLLLIAMAIQWMGFSSAKAFADDSVPNPADGNLIPEPALTDYLQANRAPGILFEASDLEDPEPSAE